MSRSVRIALLVGCAALGTLHLPAAARALSAVSASSLREVRASGRTAARPHLDDPDAQDDLHDTLAQRD